MTQKYVATVIIDGVEHKSTTSSDPDTNSFCWIAPDDGCFGFSRSEKLARRSCRNYHFADPVRIIPTTVTKVG